MVDLKELSAIAVNVNATTDGPENDVIVPYQQRPA